MDITTMSIQELKALCFDLDQDILRLQQNKQAVLQQLEKKIAEESTPKQNEESIEKDNQ